MTSETRFPSRALICEDDGLQVVAVRTALLQAGYQVIGEATEGSQAVEMAKELKPDLILMDIKMPGPINGIEAVHEIFQTLPMPIIMLTAYGSAALVNAAIDAGACAYLVKPITSEQLLPAIKTAMARFQNLQEAIHESGDIKEALETRKQVERAIEMYRERKQLSEGDAFRALQKISRDKRQTIKQTAVEILRTSEIL